jgi:hypothetical protein
MKPSLIITIDMEEGFDWSKPFSRHDHLTRTIFDHDFYMSGFYKAYNIQPIALVSYPLLNDNDCGRLLKKYVSEKQYILGTHLHSWVTPPFDEELSNFNSFAHNLPSDLEYEKLKFLTDKFIDILGYQPLYYKAGRYGIASRSYNFLHELGYQYDFTPFAKRDFSAITGVDFSNVQNKPFYPLPDTLIASYPATADYIGYLKESVFCQKLFKNPLLTKLKLRSVLAKSRLINFIPLTPEGVSENEMKNLTRTLLSQGQNYFHLSYHGSSFTINGSLYSKTKKDITAIETKLKNYIHFFQEISGETRFGSSDLDQLIKKSS